MQQSNFADSLWPAMVRLYSDERVAQLCLTLQDKFDVDVTLLMFLALADHSGFSCEERVLDVFFAEAGLWREGVVRPLRGLRRTMKDHCSTAAETALREDVKRAELQAEKLHVARLAAAFPCAFGDGDRLADRYLARRGLPEQCRRDGLALFENAMAKLAAADGEPLPHDS